MSANSREERSCKLTIRTYEKTKEELIRLTELMSQTLGTRLNRSQAVELLIKNELAKYEVGVGGDVNDNG